MMDSRHKGQWRGGLMFSLISACTKKLNKQSRCRWFVTPSRSIWRHCNAKMGFLKRSSKPFLIWDGPTAKIVDKGILQESIASEIPIHVYHGLFAPNNSKETSIARPFGRAMGVCREIILWLTFYLRIYCTVCGIVLYGTAIYREYIVTC